MSVKKSKTEAAPEATAADFTNFAQTSVDRAQQAFEKASEMAHGNVQVFDAAASAYKTRFADLQMKAMEIAQINVNSSLTFARKLFASTEPTAFFSLQQDFAREFAETFQRQAAEFNELSVQLARETAKPFQEGFSKSFAELGKSTQA